MSVTLRWKEYTNGTKSAYLDIYDKGRRRKEYLDIKIPKGKVKVGSDPKTTRRTLAEAIRTKYHNALMAKNYDVFLIDKLNSDFIEYFHDFVISHDKAGAKKYKYSYEKFLVFLKYKKYISKIVAPESVRKLSTTNITLTFSSLDKSVCTEFKDFLYSEHSKLKGETPYDYFKRFRTVVKKAIEERYLNEDPVSGIKLKKSENKLNKQILTESELRLLANTECGNSEVKRAFLFSCFTGLGEKEIRTLKWSNVVNDRLKTQRAKNGREISSKLPLTAIKLLGEHGSSGTRIFKLPSDVTVGKYLKRWVAKAGIDKHISYYCSRHSFAVLNLRNGANLKTISKLMGHTTTASTNKYLNYLDEAKDLAMDNLPDIEI